MTARTGRTSGLLLAAVLVLPAACTRQPPPTTPPAAGAPEVPGTSETIPQERLLGTWEGELEALFGQRLPVFLHVREDASGELAATVDSPSQNQKDVPVTHLEIDGTAVALEVERLGGSFAGTIDPESETASGTWRQHGLSFPLTLERTSSDPPH